MHRTQLWYLRNPFLRFIDTPADPATGTGSEPPADSGENASDESDQNDEPLGENGLKALKAERENVKQLKTQLAEANERIKTFEDRDKSEADKQAERLATAEQAAARATLKATQYEVAAAKGIPLTAASRLRGTSREEMEADADDLLALLGAGKPGENDRNPNPPKSDPSQGKGGDPKPHSLRDAISSHYNK